jgi:hypothetical protein
VRADLDFRLPILGFGEVLLELDADELPLLRLLLGLGGGDNLDYFF